MIFATFLHAATGIGMMGILIYACWAWRRQS